MGNLTGKRRKKDLRERTYAVPDSIIAGDRDRGAMETVLDDKQQSQGGFDTPAADGTLTNLVEIGQARDNLLSMKLDQVGTIGSSISLSIVLSGVRHRSPVLLAGHHRQLIPRVISRTSAASYLRRRPKLGKLLHTLQNHLLFILTLPLFVFFNRIHAFCIHSLSSSFYRVLL